MIFEYGANTRLNGSGVTIFSLSGRTAMVTGARTGIGRALAVGLAAAGADLVLHGHRDDVDDTEAEVRALGATVHRWAADFSDPAGILAPLDRVLAEVEVDVLVNNAGVIVRRPALDVGLEDWRWVQDINVTALWLVSQRVGATMVTRGAGKLVNVASMLSFRGGQDRSAYAASKHAVVGLTKALSSEWAGFGVQVNAIAPGYIATDPPSPLLADERLLARIPAHRWGRPEDLVGAAVFLASSASDYVTGHVLPVDGGWLAG
jgi:2-deoxy-D-gluconate 3-dehydrogenase